MCMIDGKEYEISKHPLFTKFNKSNSWVILGDNSGFNLNPIHSYQTSEGSNSL